MAAADEPRCPASDPATSHSDGGAPVTPGPVSLAALTVCYSHILVAEGVLDGLKPRAAFDRACLYFFLSLAPRALTEVPPAAAVLPEWKQPGWPAGSVQKTGPQKWTTRCFTWSAKQNIRLLTSGGGVLPLVDVPERTRVALIWLCQMMVIYVTGGAPLPQAARVALDRAAGRSRRHRQSVEPSWLREQVTAALDDAWNVLTARDHCGGAALLPTDRPRLADMKPLPVCRCGQPFIDDWVGRAGHAGSWGHEPQGR